MKAIKIYQYQVHTTEGSVYDVESQCPLDLYSARARTDGLTIGDIWFSPTSILKIAAVCEREDTPKPKIVVTFVSGRSEIEASHFQIQDGHLILLMGGAGQTVAAFPPGVWLSVCRKTD